MNSNNSNETIIISEKFIFKNYRRGVTIETSDVTASLFLCICGVNGSRQKVRERTSQDG